MLSLAGLSILVSVLYEEARDAIVLTYLIVVAYLRNSSSIESMAHHPLLGQEGPRYIP